MHLLSGVDVSLQSGIGSVENVLFLVNVIPYLSSAIQVSLNPIGNLLLLAQIMINLNEFLLQLLNFLLQNWLRLLDEVADLIEKRSFVLIPFGRVLGDLL